MDFKENGIWGGGGIEHHKMAKVQFTGKVK